MGGVYHLLIFDKKPIESKPWEMGITPRHLTEKGNSPARGIFFHSRRAKHTAQMC
jgi:hypothetical protein